MLATTSKLHSQASPDSATRSDSTTLSRAGANDGTQAARHVSTAGSFAGGLASGLLGPLWGLLIVVPVANRPVSISSKRYSAMVDTNHVYVDAFMTAFTGRVREERRAAAITGNLIIAIPLLIILIVHPP